MFQLKLRSAKSVANCSSQTDIVQKQKLEECERKCCQKNQSSRNMKQLRQTNPVAWSPHKLKCSTNQMNVQKPKE